LAWLLLLVIALILYGSLFPWDFHFHPLPVNPLRILMAAWPRGLDRWQVRDVVINVLLYVPLGVTAVLALGNRAGALMRTLLPLLLGVGLSTGIEVLQIFDRGRMASAFDVACNFAGTAAGICLVTAYSRQIEDLLERRRMEWKSAPAAFVLLLVWASVQLYPPFPVISRHALMMQLRPLLDSRVGTVELLWSTTEWFTAALLVEAVFSGRVLERLGLLVLLLPARLFIPGPGLRLADLAGAGAGILLWSVLARRPQPRYRIAGALIVASLVIRGLSPFHLSRAAAAFNWIPFRNALEYPWLPGGYIMLRKAYDYGSALWIVRVNGTGYGAAAALIVPLLAAMEVVQLWLPGRTPELTDPVAAAIIALAFWLIERHQAARKNGGAFR
jgi:VanZ family protein